MAVELSMATAAPRNRWRLAQAVYMYQAVAIIVLVLGAAILAPLIVPYDPNAVDLANALKAPSADHWWGTDQLGRDVLSRVIQGGRISLFIASCAVLLAGLGGALLGLIAGYRGAWLDEATMRLAEIQYALPPVILAMVLVGAIGPNTTNIIIVITLANWARFARVIRAEALSLKHRDFVLLARISGASAWWIVFRHILPNARATLIVLLTLDVGLIIILEATLSFLGLGIRPPDPSWGTMIADGRGYLERAWWISLFPGAVLLLTVLAFNALGDTLSERARGSKRGL
ncbi:peptide/nickel transport system permease protein [Bradyrhizobium sp. AZCC 2262]|uniref:ABC transporter permease n=1 Tax=Bradyrhizobium sp. AZCC 2262 TaxID=3117022 RepID=UPI002FF1CA89